MEQIVKKRDSFHFQIRKSMHEQLFSNRRKQLIVENSGAVHVKVLTMENVLSGSLCHADINALLCSYKEGQLSNQMQIALVWRIMDRKQFSDLDLIALIANLFGRPDFNKDNLTAQKMEAIIEGALSGIQKNNRDYAEMVCWMMAVLYQINNKIQLYMGLPKNYPLLISKMGRGNPFLLCLWGELSRNYKLLPEHHQILDLMELKESFTSPQDSQEGLSDMINPLSQEAITRVLEIQMNYVYSLHQRRMERELTHGEQIQYIKWVSVHLKKRQLSNKNKSYLIQLLGLLLELGLQQNSIRYLLESFIVRQLIERAKYDCERNKKACLEVLSVLVSKISAFQMLTLIRETEIIEIFVGYLRVNDYSIVCQILKATSIMLLTQEETTKKKLINCCFDKQLKWLLKSENTKVYELAVMIIDGFFRQTV